MLGDRHVLTLIPMSLVRSEGNCKSSVDCRMGEKDTDYGGFQIMGQVRIHLIC